MTDKKLPTEAPSTISDLLPSATIIDPDEVIVPRGLPGNAMAREDTGSIPADVLPGYQVGRYSEAMLADACGRYNMTPVKRNMKLNGQLYISNQEQFPVDRDGRLTYKGMVLVVWADETVDELEAMQSAERTRLLGGIQTQQPTIPIL